jgi:hypothetical protein
MKSDMEDKEWLDEYPSLKQVAPGNPFIVPSGYFEEMEQRIKSAVQLEQLKSGNGFTMPENYFDELSANIQTRINIEEFTNTENTGFTVPGGYFENLQEQINARVFVEEALSEQENEFTVPAGYFEQLNKNILNQTVNQDIVRRKGVIRKMFASGAFKYAAAACFAVIVGTGLLLIQPPAPVDHKDSFLHKQVQTISVSDIQSYLQQDVDANDTQHAVIDENAPVNSTNLSNALQQYNDDTNQ